MKRMFILFIAIMIMLGTVMHIEHNYTRDNCIVVEATESGVLIEDLEGHLWYWEGRDFAVNDAVRMKMHDSFSSAYSIDDIIKKVEKIY